MRATTIIATASQTNRLRTPKYCSIANPITKSTRYPTTVRRAGTLTG